MLNWLVAASKLHKHRVTCCTAEWPFYVFLFYGRNGGDRSSKLSEGDLELIQILKTGKGSIQLREIYSILEEGGDIESVLCPQFRGQLNLNFYQENATLLNE